MNIYTNYIKLCVTLVIPLLRVVKMTRGLPDWLALVVLVVPFLALGMVFPMTVYVFCLFFLTALACMIVDICRAARLL